jgi:pectinesterase
MKATITYIFRIILPVILGFFSGHTICSQSFQGVTGIRDSSYNTRSAYLNDVKRYQDIEAVERFNMKSVTETDNITYCQIGERELQLDVFENKTIRKPGKTALIIIHGGGWRTGNRTQHHPMAQKFAEMGYVCFTPEYRLSTEALFPAGVYDLKAAIRWVRTHAKDYQIDPDRIAVLGFSAGGELAAFLGTTGNMPLFEGSTCHTDLGSEVNAVIDMDGILSFVHPESGEGDDSRGTSAATYWFGYPKLANPLLWEAASALSYAGPNTPPTLFINSSVARMHAGREDYIKIMEVYGTYTQILQFDDAPHSFCLYRPWFDPTIAAIDLFLKKVFR